MLYQQKYRAEVDLFVNVLHRVAASRFVTAFGGMPPGSWKRI
jgi:hypothetical protein